MEIKLNWIHLKNFKGIKDFKLVANGKNVSVFADNGKGKTTLMDAFLWLLFDKDSTDRTNFTVKPQDSQGNDIHHLQTQVEAELLINGQVLKLKKMQEEKWTKRRGTATEELTGNTVRYWCDEVPVKAGEYKQKISELIDENIFRMITNPMYFNTKLSWQERRKILLEICGDATDEEVIASDKSLTKLAEILNGKSIDDYKLVLADKLKGLKKERDNIPPRIDELTLSLPQEELDYTKVEADLKALKDGLAQIEAYMVSVNSKSDEVKKKHQELHNLKNELEKIKARIKSDIGVDKKKLFDERLELENGKLLLSSGIKTLNLQIDQANKILEDNAKNRQTLLEEWRTLNDKNAEIRSEQFVVGDMTTNCPMCNQEIPKEKIDMQIEELKANFEKEMKQKLEKLQISIENNKKEGLALKSNTETTQANLVELQSELVAKEGKLQEITTKIARLEEEIYKPVAEPDYTKDSEYNELSGEIGKLQAELDKPVQDDSEFMLNKKAEIQAEIDKYNAILNSKSEVEKKKARIEELKAEEKRVSALIAELEGHKYLLEQFVVSKVNLLEGNINSHFKYVKFKMFDVQVNGGIAETCVAMINTNGSYIQFTDANLAGQINAGLDGINALCKFYGVTAPIFIDNRESVSEIIDTESQVINLIKPPTWNELDISVRGMLTQKQLATTPNLKNDPVLAIDLARQAWNDRSKTLRVEVESNGRSQPNSNKTMETAM